eukprot:6470188-Amphidinium_carterae.1
MEAKTPEQRRRSPSPMDRKWSKSPRRNTPPRGSDRRRSPSGSRDRRQQREPIQEPRSITREITTEILDEITKVTERQKISKKLEEPQQQITSYRQKKCKKGDSCKFKHQEPDMNRRSAAPVETPKTVDSAGKEICRYHLQGKCSR